MLAFDISTAIFRFADLSMHLFCVSAKLRNDRVHFYARTRGESAGELHSVHFRAVSTPVPRHFEAVV